MLASVVVRPVEGKNSVHHAECCPFVSIIETMARGNCNRIGGKIEKVTIMP